jgi:ribosome biogenesis GTPase A
MFLSGSILAAASPREEQSTGVDTEAVLRGDEAAGSGPEDELFLKTDTMSVVDDYCSREEHDSSIGALDTVEIEEEAGKLSLQEEETEALLTEAELKRVPMQLAIAGRPNVGKSTLLNTLLREERVLTGPEPGLTRDSVRVECEYEGQKFFLVRFNILNLMEIKLPCFICLFLYIFSG